MELGGVTGTVRVALAAEDGPTAMEAEADGERLAFRVERQAHDRGPGHSLAPERPSRSHVPDPKPALGSGKVEAPSRGDELAIGADRHGLDRPREVREDAPFPAGLDVPEPDLAALGVEAVVPGNAGPGRDPRAIRADRQAADDSRSARGRSADPGGRAGGRSATPSSRRSAGQPSSRSSACATLSSSTSRWARLTRLM